MIRINLTKRNIILFMLGILILFLTIFSGTYAYLALKPTSSGSITDIDATGNDAAKDTLEFIGGTPITITPGAHNMSPVEGNLVSEVSNPKAVLTTIGLEATAVYNAYLFIDVNEYVYSTLEETPELILTIIDGEGNLVTFIDGLDYTTQGSVSGFDVTNKSGYYDIGKFSITAGENEIITQTWEIKLTLINLPTDQNINQNKVFDSKIVMSQDRVLSNYLLMNHNESNGLYLHNSELINSANDGNYRYSGGNDIVKNNYLSINNYLFRIIGIYNIENEYKVKIIANEKIDDMVFDTGGDNNYDNSDIEIYLNETLLSTNSYVNSSIISPEYFYINNITPINSSSSSHYRYNIPPLQALNIEKIVSTTEKHSIALLNAYEYGFAAEPQNWIHSLRNYLAELYPTNENWMFEEGQFWLINKSGYLSTGAVYFGDAWTQSLANQSKGIKPVLYLKSDTRLIVGDGSEKNPFLVK